MREAPPFPPLSDNEATEAIRALFVAVTTLQADLFLAKSRGGQAAGSEEAAAAEGLRFVAAMLPDGHPIREWLLLRAGSIG